MPDTLAIPADAPIVALTVRQPWAELIARGAKTLEVRGRRTSHRGPLLICSGRAEPGPAGPIVDPAELAALPRGVAVAVVNLVDCRRMTRRDAAAACCPFKPGAWAWMLADARPVEPFPVRGIPGLFTVSFPIRSDAPVAHRGHTGLTR